MQNQTSENRLHHNHVTRDIKPVGKCPACDQYWQSQANKPKAEPTQAQLNNPEGRQLVQAILDRKNGATK